MKKLLKKVATFFFIIIRRFFIITNSYIKITLQILQQTIAVNDENLHYIRRKVVTKSKNIKTVHLKRKNPVPCWVYCKHL